MAEPLRTAPFERDVEQAIIALKKGAYLLKYGRRGKPKFCPFRLSNYKRIGGSLVDQILDDPMMGSDFESLENLLRRSKFLNFEDESVLIWYSGKVEKQLVLRNVSKIIPGQRTAIFKRYPRPDKEYQSFSLICNDRSLDLICKDKDEAEVWFVGLKALISHGNYRKWRLESRGDRISVSSPRTQDPDTHGINIPYENPPVNGFGKVFSDVILYTAPSLSSIHPDSIRNSLSSLSSGGVDNSNGRTSAAENFRVSLSSAVSSSSHGSVCEDFDALGDVFIWGEGIGDGFLGAGLCKVGSSCPSMVDIPLPKALESAVLLDIQYIACGSRHAALVTKQGEVFSWGEESGGRLGHRTDADVSHPKPVDALWGMNVELVACGEYHTCAVTFSGDLYTWGDGIYNSGLLGHGSEAGHWIPKQVIGQLEGLHVSTVSCGPWHTAVVTSSGQLFTFGDGIFGALGHGDRRSTSTPREVEALKGMRTIRVACGIWHTAAVVDIMVESTNSANSPCGRLFTWGYGDKGRLGHGDREHRFVPACVAYLAELSFCKVACGYDITVALTTTGRVYTMGSSVYGQLGNPEANGKTPTCIEGKLSDSFIEEIACGSYHIAVLTSKSQVYTWGKGANGRLGHGDNDDRNVPTLVDALKDKQVKSVVCGSNFTAVICLHKWVSSADQSVCSGCRLPFGFRRKRHNCYNCGLVFCKSCSSRKSVKASLAPNMNKPYRVCDECYTKIRKSVGSGMIPNHRKNQMSTELPEKELGPRLLGQGFKLTSAESFKGESRISRHNLKPEANNSGVSLIPNERTPWASLFKSRSSKNLYGSSKKTFSASVPGSRVASRSTSPVSSMTSPPNLAIIPTKNGLPSCDVIADASEKTNDSLSQEVVRLKSQVEELAHKSQLLEADLERTLRQLREVTAIAGEETSKCNAAKEVIKSLTAQLKDMAERVPEGYTINNNSCSDASHTSNQSNDSNLTSNENNRSSYLATQTPDGTDYASNPLPCNPTKTLAEETEWVEHTEPGVYITFSSSCGGEINLKRVRFSRKRFSEQQAEKWWSENRSKIQEKYRIPPGEKSTTSHVPEPDIT